MGLDVYVGTLTRYHRGDWQTIIQQLASAGQLPYPVEVVRAGGDPGAPMPEPVARAIVLKWMEALSEAVREGLPGGLEWDESSKEYFTDKPSHECWSHLSLWAAYSEHPELSRPTTFPARDYLEWSEDPAFARSQEENTAYPHLLRCTQWWLPPDFDFTLRAQDATGVERIIGSAPALLRELMKLNDHTWKADGATIQTWYKRGIPDHGCPLESGARFAFALTLGLVGKAVEFRLPMLLDY